MISTMVDFDNQVNESSLTDNFRCCITGPSMVKWFDKCLMALERAVSATVKKLRRTGGNLIPQRIRMFGLTCKVHSISLTCQVDLCS